MPGGGGACLGAASTVDAALSEARSFAGCGDGCFGDVPVFGMMTWMPMLLVFIAFHYGLRADANGRPSILRNAIAPKTGAA